MNEQEELFSPNQLQLWKIAWWANSLSGAVLVVYIISALLQTNQVLHSINYNSNFILNIRSFIFSQPWDALRLSMNMLSVILKGVVYYLVLKGVSLGLNMIVETNFNYREKSEAQNEQ